MAKPLSGKVAVVTGSAIGLGAAIATAFHREGAKVVLTGYPVERARSLAKKLGRQAAFVEGDLRDVEGTRGVIRGAIEAFGGVDILVNNAAVTDRKSLEELTPEFFETQVNVNLRAPLLLAQAALPFLKKRKGSIINIASVNSYIGWQNLIVYASTKGALVTASKNMANAFKYSRVRVYCLNPGWIDTEGERIMMKKLGHPAEFLDKEGKKFPIGRLLDPAEIAEVALFLASEKGAPFSGQVIDLEQFPIGALHHPRDTEPMQ
jgi:NAD(P)-dependent dehydrogenase (short-subunit alcohol dehydrogenase family)